MQTETAPNPIVRETPLRAYPGWVVREYRDGTFDGAQTNGPALTGGAESFQVAVAYVRSIVVDAHPVFAALSPAARATIAENGSTSEFRHFDLGIWIADASDLGLAPGQWPTAIVAVVDGQRVELARHGFRTREGDTLYVEYLTEHPDFSRTTFRVYND